MICQQLNVDKNKIIEIVGDRLGKDKGYFMDIKKAEIELDWKPNTDLKQELNKQ